MFHSISVPLTTINGVLVNFEVHIRQVATLYVPLPYYRDEGAISGSSWTAYIQRTESPTKSKFLIVRKVVCMNNNNMHVYVQDSDTLFTASYDVCMKKVDEYSRYVY